MATNTYDAIIVGSGITGGWAAKELTEKGLNVLVLEAGRTIVPEQDYVEHVPVWELKYRGWDNRAERAAHAAHPARVLLRLRRILQQIFRQRRGKSLHLSIPANTFPGFAAARSAENPSPGAARAIAGAISISKPILKDGIAVDWPIRYADIAPWYDYVEEFAGISGQAEGLPQLARRKISAAHGNDLRRTWISAMRSPNITTIAS